MPIDRIEQNELWEEGSHASLENAKLILRKLNEVIEATNKLIIAVDKLIDEKNE